MKLDSPPEVTLKPSPQGPVKKSSIVKWLVGLIVLGALAGGGYLVYVQLTNAPRQEARRRMQTVSVERVNLPISISANGTVQPERAVNMSPKNSGVLKQLLVKEGDRVEAGQILAYMDDSNLQGQMTQAKAQLTSAQANLDRLLAGNRPQEIAQAEAQLTSTQANLDRLLAGNRPQEIGQAEAQLTSAQANLDRLLAGNRPQEIGQAEAQLTSAQANLDRLLAGNRPQEIGQAEAQLASAQANLDRLLAGNRPQEIAQAEAQLTSAQANLRQAELTFNQNKQLYTAGAIALREVEASRSSYDTAKAQVKQAQEGLNLVKSGTRPEEIAQARAEVKQAQEALNLARSGSRPEEIAQARAEVKQAQEALALVKAGTRPEEITQARAEVKKAQEALDLVKSGTRTEEITQARAQVKQAQEALNLQRAGTRPEEITQARAQVMSAEGAMQTIRAQVNDTVIRAPFSGVVTRKFADPGSFVTPTTSSSSVSSATSSSILALASQNQIVAKVAETSIPQIKVGQNVTIEIDAYPGKTFKGKVTQVATQSTVEQNVTNFEVKTSIDDPENLLRAGMNANVVFEVGTLNNALVVPTVAIVRQEQGTGVYVLNPERGRPRFKPIATGQTVENKTVVVSGLEEGEQVLISFPQGRPQTRTPSLMPGMGPPGGGRGGRGGF
ncbi:efflux RND transporter periplasmic adaptor subunit [Planktothrix sp. FACHB-1355]|uniref:Efflux RND transporter periplasmic adaptor subunit n=1 Tax=Aerosakkonema funiforme FACHB-1375 TaxID=2949571 RepID=A0A926ZJ05_9CYAN|nr:MULTISPECIES: efflux RND transporter periplasmic adaptor subunit [Oscillatoriales]MBD2185033.1 efflux RND transporter periplasmic adaptor subunit [Aerosakkonema funiforme FACHB-1375]MBD3558723.1 efflux RND transporter periplasmic adaptor subunit [Planktothrix sp. FACHB-1355]